MNPDAVLFLVRAVWPHLAGAAAIGLLTGLLAWSAHPTGPLGRLVPWAGALALAAGVAASVLALVPGRAGLALDLGVLLSLAFVAGVFVGYAVRRLAVRRSSADWS